MKKKYISFWVICILWTLYHTSFFHLNDILKVADSFAYLQMSYFLEHFSQKGLWSWWFGFLYSLPIAFTNLLIWNDLLAAKIVNLVLLNISALLLWKISKKILSQNFAYFTVILFFLSPTFLHFNIHILSENIYIPLFLGLFLLTLNFTEKLDRIHIRVQIKYTVTIACLLGLMYLTRAEAFIYLGSIWVITLWLLVQKKLSFQRFFTLWGVFFLSFFLFISPYLFHLHTITGEWWLTNKWASNLRQAELRGQEKMDDAWFERAVAELTPDKHHLIAGFAGGMKYDLPQIEGTLWEFILKDPKVFIVRVITNQKKLFSRNLPEVFLGKAPQLYFSNDSRFSHIPFLIFSLLPLLILLYGTYKIFREQKLFLWLSLSFFLPAFMFFTLFFTLNRYFLIFLPLFLIIFCYGLQNIEYKKKYILPLFIGNIIIIFLLSTLIYYNIESSKDEYYNLKKDAGEWLKNNTSWEIKLMERFPIVTYYSWSKTRFITPYTNNIDDIYEYGIYNNIDILVIDSMDFKTYRPELLEYLDKTPENFLLLKLFENNLWQKVILYSLKK